MAKMTVDELLESMGHPRVDEIQALRSAILTGIDGVSEHVKWNAPSFCAGGDDRATFRLQPGDRVDLVLHRGTRTRADVDTFSFDDPTGRVVWQAPDRGVVTFEDAADVDRSTAAVVALVGAWIAATADP